VSGPDHGLATLTGSLSVFYLNAYRSKPAGSVATGSRYENAPYGHLIEASRFCAADFRSAPVALVGSHEVIDSERVGPGSGADQGSALRAAKGDSCRKVSARQGEGRPTMILEDHGLKLGGMAARRIEFDKSAPLLISNPPTFSRRRPRFRRRLRPACFARSRGVSAIPDGDC